MQITILRHLERKHIGKCFDDSRKALKAKVPTFWRPEIATFEDGPSLFELLSKLEAEGCAAIMRGLPSEPNAAKVRRRRDTVEEQPCHWLALDIDGIGEADHGPEATRLLMPECFHGKACWWQRSSSAGIKQGANYRLVFLLDEALGFEELKLRFDKGNAWGLDASVFRKTQLIYLAPPRFARAVDDPHPNDRSGTLDGEALVSAAAIRALSIIGKVWRPPVTVCQELALRHRDSHKRWIAKAVKGMTQDILDHGPGIGSRTILRARLVTLMRHCNGAKLDRKVARRYLFQIAKASISIKPEWEQNIYQIAGWVFSSVADCSYPAFIQEVKGDDDED